LKLTRLSSPVDLNTSSSYRIASSSTSRDKGANSLPRTSRSSSDNTQSLQKQNKQNKSHKQNKNKDKSRNRISSVQHNNNNRDNDDNSLRNRSGHKSMSNITFGEAQVNNILNNSSLTFNKNDDDKRLIKKQERSTSKSSRTEQNKHEKKMKESLEEAKMIAKLKANNRIGDQLLDNDIKELLHLGFFTINQDDKEEDVCLLYDVVDLRKNAARGIRTKSLTSSGAEASLSQTLAEHRMCALTSYFESRWPISDKFDFEFDHTSSSGATGGKGGLPIEFKKDILPVLLKVETKLERAHALLEVVSVLHSAGGAETVAAVFCDAAAAPGGSYWDSEGIKLDKVVALRLSDHCRIAVAVAKSTLLRKRALKGGGDTTATTQQIMKLQSEVTLLSAETINARGSVFEVFGESSFDSRSHKQDELLMSALSRGNKEIESSPYAVSENLRMLKVGGDSMSF